MSSMPASADKQVTLDRDWDGRRLAVKAEALYVLNLLLFPLVAFLVLLFLYRRHHATALPLARNHLEQAVGASLWLGAFFVMLGMFIYVLDMLGIDEVTLWMIVVITFTIVHATMVLLGVFGLSRAMAGKCYRYPLVGRRMPTGC